jgi:hypothetical protein
MGEVDPLTFFGEAMRGKILYKLLGVLAGLVFAVYGLIESSHINRIKKLGHVAVVAPISDYSEMKSRGGSTYTATFRFATDTGKQVIKGRSFPGELIADFKAGIPVRVIYLPNDPHTFVFEKEGASWLLIGGGTAIVVLALIFA